jgi:hypothetical protein
MTEDQKKAYLESTDKCPYCQSPDIVGEEYTYEGGEVCQTIRCESCCRAWREVFRLAEVEEVGQPEPPAGRR